MPDYISIQVLKMKALERWENEGGRISTDQTEKTNHSIIDERSGTDKVLQTSEDPTIPMIAWPVYR